MTSRASNGEMRVLDDKGIGLHRPHVLSRRNEREVGLERTWRVLRGHSAVADNCVKFSFILWFTFLMVGLMRLYLEAGSGWGI